MHLSKCLNNVFKPRLIGLWLAMAAGAALALDTGLPPTGKGAGVFDPNSQFAPLQDRADVVPWPVLTSVTTRVSKNKVVPVFNPAVQALDAKTQRIQGYMMPLDPGEKQTHFLVTSVPLSCPFCVPGGPESMVEVKTKSPVRYSLDPVVVEGKLSLLPNDPSGLFYRLSEAQSVK
jgi:uncharacterized protein